MTDQKAREQALAEAQKPVYIGDGVYAKFDGFSIWLETNGSQIALEPVVFESLVEYRATLKRAFVAAGFIGEEKGTLG